MVILGINAYHADSAACIVIDGKLVAALEEERIRRIKHWAGFPIAAIRFCLDFAGVKLSEVDHVAIGRNPSAHIHKKVLFALRRRPAFAAIKERLANMASVQSVPAILARALDEDPATLRARFHNIEHHRAHMASSFFLSPFDKADCLTMDGFGDFVSTMFGKGEGNHIQVSHWLQFPHSLGLFYTAVTQYLGFLKYGDEYKVMGLAAYGNPEYVADMKRIIRLRNQGRFLMDLDWFRHHSQGVEMVWDGGYPEIGPAYSDRWVQRYGPARAPEEPLEQRHKDMAHSLQAMTEEAYFHAINYLARTNNARALCLAGGCAFNSVANGKVFERSPYRDLHIHPAAGDAGTAVGAAFYVWHQILGKPRSFVLEHAFWGPEYPEYRLKALLKEQALPFEWIDNEDELCQRAAQRIAQGDVVGWFQGRSEWGPRALGNRSILVDPRRHEMKDILNARIKRREWFRPFAPSILDDSVAEYFEESYPVPFMLQVYKIRPEKRPELPAVTHVDGTGRLQTVSKQNNPLFHRLLKAFAQATGTPVVLNTSFNENEPIVNTPEEAVDCFLRTKMDTLVLGKAMVTKNAT